MPDLTWGLLGPEMLPSLRRTRTLGLGAVVRSVNDLAVPGLGGVWFGKQILLALIGVLVAEEAGARKIEVANAVEALACWLAFKNRNWTPDPRLRGNRKLRSRTDLTFTAARQRSFYVSQPMRMATVRVLPALGLVEARSARFNDFTCTGAGRELVEMATAPFRPYNRSLLDYLVLWVRGEAHRIDSAALDRALSPVEPLPETAAGILHDRLVRGGPQESPDATNRRRDALQWVESCRTDPPTPISWEIRPVAIRAEHWRDLHAGALFFGTRNAALAVLEALEHRMPAERKQALDGQLVTSLEQPLVQLRQAADAFLNLHHADELAVAFCRECSDDYSQSILRHLVKRDDRVLRLQGTHICPGPAFRGGVIRATESEDEAVVVTGSNPCGFPADISPRISNLFWLNLDLRGELDRHLVAQVQQGDDQ